MCNQADENHLDIGLPLAQDLVHAPLHLDCDGFGVRVVLIFLRVPLIDPHCEQMQLGQTRGASVARRDFASRELTLASAKLAGNVSQGSKRPECMAQKEHPRAGGSRFRRQRRLTAVGSPRSISAARSSREQGNGRVPEGGMLHGSAGGGGSAVGWSGHCVSDVFLKSNLLSFVVK